MRRLGQLVFIGVASVCLSQDILFLTKLQKEAPKVYVDKKSGSAGKNKNIDKLFMEFLLR